MINKRQIVYFISILFFLVPFASVRAEDIVTEKIVYAVNDDYAQTNPNWQANAKNIIDYTNRVLAQNTNKRYEIGAYKTFSNETSTQLKTDPAYTYDNGYGGTTVFDWVVMPNSQIQPESLLSNVANSSVINNVQYQQIFLVENHPEFSMLSGNVEYLDGSMGGFLHELGHTMGLGVPDWYFYEFDDLSGVDPHLPPFSLRAKYAFDPMASWRNFGYKYSDFNAIIINQNLRHEKSFSDIQNTASTSVKVVVRDENNNPVDGATVQVFGAKKGCFYCQTVTTDPLVETVTTAASGEATISPPSTQWSLNEDQNSKYIALVVKVSKGSLKGGDYIYAQELQENKFRTGSDVYSMPVTITADYLEKAATVLKNLDAEKNIKINNVQTTGITDTAATVSWETTWPATTYYRIGTVDTSNSQPWIPALTADSNNNKTHSVGLQNLLPGQRYRFQIYNFTIGIAGLFVVQNVEFNTLNTPASTPPVTPKPTPAQNNPSPASAPPVTQKSGTSAHANVAEDVMSRERARFTGVDKQLVERLRGRILLQIQEKGEAWWLDPATGKRRFMGNSADAYSLMRSAGLGITNADLNKIPVGYISLPGTDSDQDGLTDDEEKALGTNISKKDSDGDGHDDLTEVINNFNSLGAGKLPQDIKLINRLRGRILLQIQGQGEAWYVNPSDGKRYFLGRAVDAISLMRKLGLGIKNSDLNKIPLVN